MKVQEAVTAAAVVVVALGLVALVFFIAGSILFALGVAVPVVIVVALVAGLLFGDKTVIIRRDNGKH